MRYSVLAIAAVLLLSFGMVKTLLVIFAVWLAVAFVVGVAVGRMFARRDRHPHFGPRPHLYDQDQESHHGYRWDK